MTFGARSLLVLAIVTILACGSKPAPAPRAAPIVSAPPAALGPASARTGMRIDAGTTLATPDDVLFPEASETPPELAWRVTRTLPTFELGKAHVRVVLAEAPGNGAAFAIVRTNEKSDVVLGGFENIFGGNGVEIDATQWIAADHTVALVLVHMLSRFHGTPGTVTKWLVYAVREDRALDVTPTALAPDTQNEPGPAAKLVPHAPSVQLVVRERRTSHTWRFDTAKNAFVAP